MNSLKVCAAILPYFFTQLPQSSPEITQIKQYISGIDTSKSLVRFTLDSYPGHRDTAGRDSLLLNYESIYFPCTAVITYSAGRIVRIKEIIRYNSDFETYQYYLKNDSLVFAEQKRIFCDYQKQSNKIVYTEQDYQAHTNYYFKNNHCIAEDRKGAKPFFVYGSYRPQAGQPRTPSGFFLWQAARYLALFGKASACTKRPPNFRP